MTDSGLHVLHCVRVRVRVRLRVRVRVCVPDCSDEHANLKGCTT